MVRRISFSFYSRRPEEDFFRVPVFQFAKKPPPLTAAFLSGMEMRAELRPPTHATGATRSSYEACLDGKRGAGRALP